MIKNTLKQVWKWIKISIKIIFVIWIFISFISINGKLNSVSETLDYQISDLNDRYNNVVQNEIELSKQLQESYRTSKKDLQSLQKDTIIEIELMSKMIIESTKNTYMNERILKNVINSDVFVQSIFGIGGGTVIKKTENEMYVITCYHVVAEIVEMNRAGLAISATIGYSKTDESDKIAGMIVYATEIIKYDIENDMALLKVKTVDKDLIAVNLAEKAPVLGDTVFSVGSPLGLLRTIFKGIVSHKEDGFYFVDATTTFGNSGGGLYNLQGELIGIPAQVMGYGKTVEGNFVSESSLGMSISLDRIKKFLRGAI